MTSSQFLTLVQGNWSFADLPSSTWAERRYKCNRKIDFGCDCKTASKTYDIGYQDTTHPFCLENPTHGSCTGGCLDIFDTNFISAYATQGACEAVTRTWTPPLMPTCRQENGNDVYGATCNTETKCLQNCAGLNNCVDSNGFACAQSFWEDNVVDQSICTKYGLGDQPCIIPPQGIAGKCVLNGQDVTSTYATESDCKSAMTWIPPVSIMKTYYEMSKFDNGVYTENQKRQCAAGSETQTSTGSRDCPYHDPFCNRYPKIDEVDRDNDNYNQFLLHSSFTKLGNIEQCTYLGALENSSGLYDAQKYPLAPCPDSSVPYYCDFPQNEMFGKMDNSTGTPTQVDTTCGVGLYNNKTRQANGLPHGIREYNNGYDRQAWQWSVEMEDPVSAGTAINKVLTEMESIQMNIFSVGKLVDKKYILTSHREGIDEYKVNAEIAMELNGLFSLLAKTGDSVPQSELKNETEVRQAAEWSPSDVDENGLVSQLRCHSVPDSKIEEFRQIKDVRRDFIDRFFEANTEQKCDYGQASLDDEARSFQRCDNSEESQSFLYPSARKAFFNPITSDGYLSGFQKGQRFIKEMSQSTDTIGVVEAGLRTMPDGTKVPQNATFKHIKFMMAMSTEQLEQCNTVVGHCRNIWYQFPRKTYAVADISRLQEFTDDNHTHVEGCKLACINEAECGGFEIDIGKSCKLVKASGTRKTTGTYDDLRMEVEESTDFTAYFLERPNCEFRILGTRKYDAKNDGVDGLWGVSYDQNGGERWGYQTCRTSITVKKLEKIDKVDVEKGLFNDPGEYFVDDYPYSIIIQDEDCLDATIEMKESVAQETSEAVSLSEAQEVVKITATSTPDWCKTENGFYTGEQKQAQDGGVCLSHKQLARSEILEATNPFGSLVPKQPQCLDESNVDQITKYPTKLECMKAAAAAEESWLYKEAVNLEHRGREAECRESLSSGNRIDCLNTNGDTSWDIYSESCSKYHALNKTECDAAQHTWIPEVVATGTMAYIPEKAKEMSRTLEGSAKPFSEKEMAKALKYEDERLTCSHLGTIPQQNGAQRSKYDRVRLVLWVDVLRLKDLYDEGKGASSIISRGMPVGLTEGYDSGCKDCVVREVGQHKLQSSDQDVVYYDAIKQQACSKAQLGGDCKEYSFDTGYRATGIGDTFRGRTQQERDERNQIRQVIGKYLVRDVGLNSAGATGKAFWQDDLTTISYLGTATTSVKPLEESVQDLRENFGDSKIYSRYMIELFSDCLDRTRVQEHSSRLEFQIFKEGRLHGDRLRDSLPELSGGAWNAGMTKYDVTAEEADALITVAAKATDIRPTDLVTLSGCSDSNDDGNYYVSGINEVAEVTTSSTPTTHAVKSQGNLCNSNKKHATPLWSNDFTDVNVNLCAQLTENAVVHGGYCEKVNGNNNVFDEAVKSEAACSGTWVAVPDATNDFGFRAFNCDICLSGYTEEASASDIYTVTPGSTTTTNTGNYVVKATLAAYPTEPRAVGAPLTGKTFSSGCKIAQKERSCDGYSYDIRTDALLAKASTKYDSFQIDTRDICGPVELDTTGCDFTNPLSCNYLKPCGPKIPADVRNDYGWPSTCVTPSEARCQICNRDTPQCYDGVGTHVPDGALVGHTMHEDMQCAGYDYSNPNVKLGITTMQIEVGDNEHRDNLDFVDIPVEDQTYGNIFGAELLEFSVGLRLMDTIDFEQDQYLTLKGIGSRTEVIAWLKNNRIGEMNNLRDVRDMGDLTYPQLTTEEVVFTVQTYDREHDPNNFNVNIESLTICSHQPPSYFEPFISSGAINRNVVNCIIGRPNDGTDAFGQPLSASELANAPAGSDPCLFIFETCPMKSGTGYTMQREEDDFFLLADYRPLFGADGHLFVGDTCDMVAVSRALDMLTLPTMNNADDDDLVYVNARNIPLQASGGTFIAGSGRHAVESACVNPPSATGRAPEPSDFFKALGPKNNQIPVSQTIVRNFKSMAIEDAKRLKRGIREVIPCRRLSTHGDNLSPEFANAILYGYEDERSYGSLSEFGNNYEPKSCWRDSYITTCREPHTDVDRTYQLDTKEKCIGSGMTLPRSTATLVSHKCEEFQRGTISSASSAVTISMPDGAAITTQSVCLQQCEMQHFEKCIFYGDAQVCKGDDGDNGNIQELIYDATSTNFVTNCSARTVLIEATAVGQFKGITESLTVDAPTDLEHAQSLCGVNAECVGFHAKAGDLQSLKCDTGVADDELDTVIDVVQTYAVQYNGLRESCLKLCQDNSDATVLEYVANNGGNNGVCKCKAVKTGKTCLKTSSADVANHFVVPNKLDAGDMAVVYEFFKLVDPDNLGEDHVMSTRYYKTQEDTCHWCKWTNADKRTHSNDSEDCMTNVLDHLKSASSFQTYMDNIGGSVNFEEEVCVQKNNLWREKGTKHIPCGYRSLFNFNMDSVYKPEGWVLTDEEKAYRLSPDSPSWDSIIFAPEDVGNIGDHWEPVTKDFILPIKAEIVIHGSTCTADYDLTSGDSISNGRRRLLGNKQRIRFGNRRKLLQFEDASAMVPQAEFGGTTSSAFNVLISVTAENVIAKQILGPNGEILKPGDPLYPVDADGDGDVQDEIYETIHKMQQADLDCLSDLQTMWIGLGFVMYYGVLFILSLLLLGVPDKITGKPMNIFFDVLSE
ncbi:MAG: hypothetical protein CMO44_02850 [Verrucomicrobiales bacterium]|nr:hypothetical protein [Verrucomicrobiales bacterium]